MNSCTGELFTYESDTKMLIYYGSTGIVYKNHLIKESSNDYIGARSVGTRIGFMMKDNEASNISVFKSHSAYSKTLTNVSDKFLVNKCFLEDFIWRTNKIEAELNQNQIRVLLSSN